MAEPLDISCIHPRAIGYGYCIGLNHTAASLGKGYIIASYIGSIISIGSSTCYFSTILIPLISTCKAGIFELGGKGDGLPCTLHLGLSSFYFQ